MQDPHRGVGDSWRRSYGWSRKEELGEGKGVSLNTLSLRKTKIRQDYSTSLELKKGEDRVFLCASQ